MADSRVKHGVWQGNRQSIASLITSKGNDPIHHGWRWDDSDKVYRLKYAGMEAQLRRPTFDECKEFNLTSLYWLVQIGDNVSAYSGWVDAFTPEVKKDLCAAVVVRASQPEWQEADDYGLGYRGL